MEQVESVPALSAIVEDRHADEEGEDRLAVARSVGVLGDVPDARRSGLSGQAPPGSAARHADVARAVAVAPEAPAAPSFAADVRRLSRLTLAEFVLGGASFALAVYLLVS